MVNVFYAKHASVKIDAAGTSSFAANVVLDTAASSATSIEGQIKDLKITLAIGDVEKIDLLGSTSSFQNAELDEKPAELSELSGTLVLPGDELMSSEIFGAGTSATTHTTYQSGLATRTPIELMINLDDGSGEVSFAFDNMVITEWNGSVASDSHVEITFTGKCLPRDTFGPQFKD